MNQTLYTGRRIKKSTNILRCQILCYDADAERMSEDLGIDIESEDEWMDGVLALDKVSFAYENATGGEECVTVVLGSDRALIRMSFAEFWEIYANSQAP